MKRAIIIFVLLLTAAVAANAANSQATADSQPILPKVFAGWTKSSTVQTSKDPSAADPTNAALLKEDGFNTFEQADYTRGDRKITVKAARFNDASGAYSAFTVYKEPDMQTVDMGGKAGESLGASLNNRVLFYRQNVLVQATFDRITAMTAGEVRELASLLPQATDPSKKPPILPTYLPKQSYVKNSAKYVMGPVGLAQIGSPVPGDVVGFSQEPEVVTGKYNTGEGIATLMLISYPTPAIAGDHLRAIEVISKNAQTGATSPELAGPIYEKRTGPMVVLAAGKISPDEAKSLLASVNYDANVTWDQSTKPDKSNDVGAFLVNLIVLIGILILLALGFGVAFGGFRVLAQRLWPGKVFDRPEDLEFIQLNIRK